jgi:hypothetical protein
MKRPRHSSYPMAIEEAEELAAELSEFGYRETDDADRRRSRSGPGPVGSMARCMPSR